jgi:hypothetical protein
VALVTGRPRPCAGLGFAPGTAPRIRCVRPAPIYNFVSLSLAPRRAPAARALAI